MMDNWAYEKQARLEGCTRIVGLDEAGRGPLAGPVVAAAVLLAPDSDATGINDSKTLSPMTRERLFHRIMSEAEAVGIGVIGPEVIDRVNILRATHIAMKAALDDLGADFDFVLLDGLPVAGLGVRSLPIIRGDSKSVSIAAASIIAKVTRDNIMTELDGTYPQYGFASHKGYCTAAHLSALDRHGPCPCHRRSFAPVSERVHSCCLPGLG